VKILWTASTVVFFEVIYLHTDEVGGWSKFEMLLLLGSFTVVRAISAAFFSDGPAMLPEFVRSGRLDLILTKPVNSQFTISVSQEDIGDFTRLFLGLALIFYSITNLGASISPVLILFYFLLILASVISFYSFSFMLITTSIWLVRVENIDSLAWHIISLGRVPVSVFPKAVSFILTFIVPVAFASMVPAQVLLNQFSWPLVVYGLCLSVVLLYFSHRFWNFALKHYTSAGG
jgi:ABC-2 type transport system permease protein